MKVYSTWLIINSILYNHSCKILYISNMNGSHYVDSCNPVYGGDRILWCLVIFSGEILSLIHYKLLKKLYIHMISYWSLTMHIKEEYWPLYNKYFKGYLRTPGSCACLKTLTMCSKQAYWPLYRLFKDYRIMGLSESFDHA